MAQHAQQMKLEMKRKERAKGKIVANIKLDVYLIISVRKSLRIPDFVAEGRVLNSLKETKNVRIFIFS